MFGCRAFSVAGPAAWNSLPDYMRDPSLSTNSFCRDLKNFFSGFTSVHSALDRGLVIMHCINLLITRISIQTAGLVFGGTGLCSYRVRGVDGSCAEHSTVESYTIFICQQSYLLLFGDHPLTLSLQA